MIQFIKLNNWHRFEITRIRSFNPMTCHQNCFICSNSMLKLKWYDICIVTIIDCYYHYLKFQTIAVASNHDSLFFQLFLLVFQTKKEVTKHCKWNKLLVSVNQHNDDIVGKWEKVCDHTLVIESSVCLICTNNCRLQLLYINT